MDRRMAVQEKRTWHVGCSEDAGAKGKEGEGAGKGVLPFTI